MTWYVSPHGDDAWAGTSPRGAWRSLARLNGIELGPGDAILLDCHGAWNEPLEIRATGSREAPALVASWDWDAADEGPAADEGLAADVSLVTHGNLSGWEDGFTLPARPCISWPDGPAVRATDCSHLVIRGVEVDCSTESTLYPDLDGVDDPDTMGPVPRHPRDEVNCGILVTASLEASEQGHKPLKSVTICDTYVHGSGPDQNSEGILVSAETSTEAIGPTLIGVVIRDNLVENVGWRGIGTGMQAIVASFEGEPWKAIRDVTIEGNAARFVGLQGICAFNAHGVVLRRNLVDRAGWYRGVGATWGPAGLWPWSCSDVLVEYNEVRGMFDGNTGADATGIDIDWNSRDVIVRSNHCYENMGCGIVTMSCLRGTIEHNRVEGNLGKVNMGPGQIGLCDYQTATGPHAITGVTDVHVRENLIILDRDNTSALSTVKTSEGPPWSGVAFTGNRIVVFDHARDQSAYDIAEGTQVERYSANVFYGIDQESFRAAERGRECSWRMWADAGNDHGSGFAPLDDTAPSRVRNLVARRAGADVRLGWSAARDTRSGVHHYNVYRGRCSGFPRRYLTLVGQPTDPVFTDRAVPSGEIWYAVEAEDACGNRSGHAAIVVVSTAER